MTATEAPRARRRAGARPHPRPVGLAGPTAFPASSPAASAPRSPEPSSVTRGSVLFLFPAGMLIVILLGAIAVDLGNVWLQQRRLADAADAAANDAVTYGLDRSILRADGTLALDADRVHEIVEASLAAHDLPEGWEIRHVRIAADPAGRPVIEIRLHASIPLLFGRMVRTGGLAVDATGAAVIATD